MPSQGGKSTISWNGSIEFIGRDRGRFEAVVRFASYLFGGWTEARSESPETALRPWRHIGANAGSLVMPGHAGATPNQELFVEIQHEKLPKSERVLLECWRKMLQ